MICVIEDDASIRELVVYALISSGFEATGFECGDDFFAATLNPELILLDVMLPGEDGISILKTIRKTSKVPIVMMTAKGSEFDKVMGLDQGADDYITKPFGVMELIARVKAVLRRVSVEHGLKSGDIEISTERHMAWVSGKEVNLTLKEFELLAVLLKNVGMVLTRDRLLTEVWGMEFSGETRTVDVHIATLRQKLGDSGAKIETVRGVGYKVN